LIILNLPYPPSINSYWRANGHRRFISKEGVLFREKVAKYMYDYKVPRLGGSVRLQMEIVLYPKDRRLQDIDNRVKALWDALEGWVYEDDAQIDVLIVKRGEIRKGGGCLVMIEELDIESRQE
jgi:crossover junction endodeoxyribonuclease RusA